jgi:hypothetical protein
MDGGMIPENSVHGKFQNKRSVGKLRKRWEDDVQRDA